MLYLITIIKLQAVFIHFTAFDRVNHKDLLGILLIRKLPIAIYIRRIVANEGHTNNGTNTRHSQLGVYDSWAQSSIIRWSYTFSTCC